MKCLCGYEYIEEDPEGKGVGDKPFHQITFNNGGEYADTVYAYISQEGIYNDLIQDVYACPKCGTLKINT